MTDSATLIREYVGSGSEEAFAEVVRNHVDLVYCAALRVVAGDEHLAHDVAQVVFTDLARKAARLPSNVVLAGWLYRHTCFTAAKAIRGERRRQAREREAVAMRTLNEDEEQESLWSQMAPVLDDAMNRLGPRERDAIVLRFFERKPLRAVGEALGVSEEAARKRVDRALHTLRALFRRRGVSLSAAALASVVAAKSVSAAPAGLAASLAGASLAAGAAPASIGIWGSLKALARLTRLQGAAVGLLFMAGVATPMLSGSPPGGTHSKLSAGGAPFGRAKLQPASTPAEAAASARTNASPALARLEAWLRQEIRLGRQDAERGYARAMDLQFLIWSLPAADYARAWELRHGIPQTSVLCDQFERELVCTWALLEPRAAVQAAATLGSGSWGNDASYLALGAWAEQEPAAALAWVRLSSPARFKDSRLAFVIPRLARIDPQAALTAVAEIDSAKLRRSVLANLVQEWAGRNPAGAIEWVKGMAAGRGSDGVLRSLCQGLANSHPEQAAQVVAGLPPGRLHDELARDLAVRWAIQDPAAAAQWVASLPEGPAMERAAQALLGCWLNDENPASGAEALRWLQQMPVGPTRDRLAQRCLVSTGGAKPMPAALPGVELKYPELAAPWVDAISDAGLREKEIERVARKWLETDREAARKWLRGTSLSEEKKHQLLDE
jgi:RNA polymerase sigma factor (sigma-70 family)